MCLISDFPPSSEIRLAFTHAKDEFRLHGIVIDGVDYFVEFQNMYLIVTRVLPTQEVANRFRAKILKQDGEMFFDRLAMCGPFEVASGDCKLYICMF